MKILVSTLMKDVQLNESLRFYCEDIKQEWAKNMYTFLVQIQKLIVLCMDTLEVDIEEENKDE